MIANVEKLSSSKVNVIPFPEGGEVLDSSILVERGEFFDTARKISFGQLLRLEGKTVEIDKGEVRELTLEELDRLIGV